MGRKQTTGKFKTRKELVEAVHFFYHKTGQSQAQVARTTQTSEGVVAYILETNLEKIMSKKKTSAFRAYQMLQTLPVGSSFQMKDIMSKMPDYVSASAVGNMLWHMKEAKHLAKLPGTQKWSVLDNTKNYHEVHKFNENAYSPPTVRNLDATAPVKRKYTKRKGVATDVTSSDMDIIEELLTAMARAEPVLRKYKQLDEIVKKFAAS